MRKPKAHLLVGVVVAACGGDAGPSPETRAFADSLVQEALLVDANILTPYRLALDSADVTGETGWGEFDHPRAVAGGLDLAVLEALIPQSQDDPEALADRLLGNWNALVAGHPDRFRLITTAAQLETPLPDEVVGVLLGVENGVAVGETLDGVQRLFDQGVRLMTPVHSQPNGIGDSSYSQRRPWSGLSEFGRSVIAEMNRLGMIVDVSHMSDEAVVDVLATSTAPVIASHSAARRYTLGWERNLSDELIEGIAAGGGVIHVPFGGSFLWAQIQDAEQPVWDFVEDSLGLSINSRRGRAEAQRFREESGIGYASVADVARQIDYIVDQVGVEHVGFGSGFDGSGDSMPYGLKDVSQYASLVAELVDRGYTEEELRAMMGGNFLSVWQQVERAAGARSGA